MSRKFLIVLIVMVAVVLCIILVSHFSDGKASLAEQGEKKALDSGARVDFNELTESSKVRSSRRNNQAEARPSSITTESGLIYQVLREGSGKKPGPTDTVKVVYRGWIRGGEEFDKTPEGQPIELPLNQVIKGWQEGVQLMGIGAKYRLIIPAELAYGESSIGGKIPSNSTLVFDIELIDVK